MADSVPKEFLEPVRRQSGVTRGVLNVAVTQIRLDRTRVVANGGELIAAGTAVGLSLDARIGRRRCPFDHAADRARR